MFNQTGWTVQGDVYNVAGNLILNKDSKRDDFLSSLDEVKRDVSALKSLPAEAEQQIQTQLAAIVEASKQPIAQKESIHSKLEGVKSSLEALKDTAEGAWELAKTVGAIATWVTKFMI